MRTTGFVQLSLLIRSNGRDALVTAAVGTTSFGGVTYSTTSETLTGVMVVGTTGVNHGELDADIRSEASSHMLFFAQLSPLMAMPPYSLCASTKRATQFEVGSTSTGVTRSGFVSSLLNARRTLNPLFKTIFGDQCRVRSRAVDCFYVGSSPNARQNVSYCQLTRTCPSADDCKSIYRWLAYHPRP